jgi:hypothetical protein
VWSKRREKIIESAVVPIMNLFARSLMKRNSINSSA